MLFHVDEWRPLLDTDTPPLWLLDAYRQEELSRRGPAPSEVAAPGLPPQADAAATHGTGVSVLAGDALDRPAPSDRTHPRRRFEQLQAQLGINPGAAEAPRREAGLPDIGPRAEPGGGPTNPGSGEMPPSGSPLAGLSFGGVPLDSDWPRRPTPASALAQRAAAHDVTASRPRRERKRKRHRDSSSNSESDFGEARGAEGSLAVRKTARRTPGRLLQNGLAKMKTHLVTRQAGQTDS